MDVDKANGHVFCVKHRGLRGGGADGSKESRHKSPKSSRRSTPPRKSENRERQEREKSKREDRERRERQGKKRANSYGMREKEEEKTPEQERIDEIDRDLKPYYHGKLTGFINVAKRTGFVPSELKHIY